MHPNADNAKTERQRGPQTICILERPREPAQQHRQVGGYMYLVGGLKLLGGGGVLPLGQRVQRIVGEVKHPERAEFRQGVQGGVR